jgi:CubicO group peptidase (beta-lactamase class C family)
MQEREEPRRFVMALMGVVALLSGAHVPWSGPTSVGFASLGTNVETASAEDPAWRKVDALVKAHAKLDMSSGTVLVARRGEMIYEAAVGEADKDHRVPNRADARFNVGSIGKTFTAVSIMQLVQNGRLQLTDTLDKFLPECPFPEKATISIEHLLTHSSGLGDYLMHPDYRSKMVTLRTVSDKLALVYSQKPEFPAGERLQYSNSGFLVLGAIIEKISGLSYPAYLQKHVLQPAGMTDTELALEDEVVPNRSIGYTKNCDGTYTANILVVPPPCPAGGLRTTARDLLKFDRALAGSLLLSEASKARMFAPSRLRPTVGLGWEVKEYHGHRFVGHSGGTDGVEAFFYRFIDDGYTVVTLSNYDRGNGLLCSAIEAILFGQAYELPTVADANFLLGYGMQSEGKHREAVRVFARNLETEPPHLMSLFMAASSRVLGEFELEKAIAELDRYIELAGKDAFPPVSMAWARKGSAFKLLGKIAEAIGCYKKDLELDPNDKAAEGQIKTLRGKRLP